MFGYNMFAYCYNNRVNYVDYTGKESLLLAVGSAVLSTLGKAAVFAAKAMVVAGTLLLIAEAAKDAIDATVVVDVVISMVDSAISDSADSEVEAPPQKIESSEIKSDADYDPNSYKRAGEKKQNRENRSKSRSKAGWNPRNNRRDGKPAKPKSHTPSKKGTKSISV